jgi:hypothetical protein
MVIIYFWRARDLSLKPFGFERARGRFPSLNVFETPYHTVEGRLRNGSVALFVFLSLRALSFACGDDAILASGETKQEELGQIKATADNPAGYFWMVSPKCTSAAQLADS